MAQGQASDPKNAYPVAHWSEGKRRKDVSVPGIACPSNPFARLSPWEADTLANYGPIGGMLPGLATTTPNENHTVKGST
ncbi:hypothetical protein PENNAL_c0005G06986 [Penicillium nalgiovense]|uniref:Uncharacterized protein n=1 Tax=Penicillium nalgiovense TaxID=60175 RepID=A0A1V6Z201_PENNA|nr:hypothetical protein PENNAL_c0005G06986 [Penicillium nalgiovense]